MTWEETIQYIRTNAEYTELVDQAYFEENLPLNVERFRQREEYAETKKLINKYLPDAKTILDVGSGNGVSAISFALEGYEVTATEPDKSDTIGAGAIKRLKEYYHLDHFTIFESCAEDINPGGRFFDIVYVRQAMHHAYDLNKFISNLSKYLREGGIMITVRDHVIYNENDKKWFLECHPLHKFYGGENAFTEQQYKNAFRQAELEVKLILRYFDSVINFFPETKGSIIEKHKVANERINKSLRDNLGFIGKTTFVKEWYKKHIHFDPNNPFDETKVPGRMYSFIAQKG